MRAIATLAASLWLLGTATGAAQERHRPVSGAVTDVDLASHTLTLADGDYYVPAEVFKLGELKTGDQVVVHWEERGDRRVATEVVPSNGAK